MLKYVKWVKHLVKKLFKSFNYRSLQFVIAACFMTVMIIAMIFVGSALTKKFSKLEEQNAYIHTRQIINQVNHNLDYYLRNMLDIYNYLNDEIYYTDNVQSDDLKNKMKVVINSRKDIVSISLFSQEGELLTSVPSYQMKDSVEVCKEDWFTACAGDTSNVFFSSPHVQNLFDKQHNWVISESREITYKVNGIEKKGILLVDMNIQYIDELCEKAVLGKKGYVYIIDSKGNIVYHPNQQLINSGLKKERIGNVLDHVFGSYVEDVNNEKRVTVIETVNYSRWRLIGIAYMDEILTTRHEVVRFAILTLFIGALFATFMSTLISKKVTQPVKELEKSMKIVEQGNFDININIEGDQEVVHLSKTFNMMVTRIRNLMDQIVKEQEAKRISELNALQAQINPHFLYNTLDSIVWMSERNKNDEAIIMVTSLAKLFRISISKGRNVIYVSEEIEHARNYLIIQKMRYKNKFEFTFDVQDEVKDYKTIKLILQPMIENAIYHGIRYMVDEGLIEIRASKVSNKLLFEVIDNGMGMSEEVLNNLLSENKNDNKYKGVGVQNVNQRIKLYCGEEYGLDIESEIEEGTIVRIRLPLIKNEDEKERI